jgi:hypothetical protein
MNYCFQSSTVLGSGHDEAIAAIDTYNKWGGVDVALRSMKCKRCADKANVNESLKARVEQHREH